VIWSEGLFISSNGKNVTSAQSFSDPSGDGVASIPVTAGGSGYLAAPFVEITGGGGTGATAVANLSPAGVVTGITVTNPGQNYTSAPMVVLHGGVGGTGLVVGTPATSTNVKGDFHKLGQGNLTLSNGQTYTGSTFVSEGTLTVNGTIPIGSGPIAVAAGATLSGTGFVQNVAVSGTLKPGNPTGSLLTAGVTFAPGSTLSITINDSDVNSNFNGKLDATGNIDISNVNLKVNVTGAAAMAPYEILTTTGTVLGDFASVPAGVEYTISGGKVTITKAGTPFQTFIGGYFPGVSDPLVVGEDADPDGDGSSNLVEYALGGIPNAGGDGPKVYTRVADSSDAGAEKELLMTVAVLPGFPAAPAAAASYKGVNYQVQGSLDLVDFTSPVSQVDPVTGDLPPVPAGYEYRTFRLDASNGVPNKGFMRVQVK
jgi:autotransporter-associated beta strand protein